MDDEQQRWQQLSERFGALVKEMQRFEQAEDRSTWLSGGTSARLEELERCFGSLQDAWQQFLGASWRAR
jgi:hypothetical protein